MYVDALITLQENLATYAVEGKKVTGHVTISSPGMIKCYIQNLKGQQVDSKYALYAFSKAQSKGVRIGKLGKNKETKWMVSEKNVQSSGLKLEELDAVAIVAENEMRGVDAVAMGFKNNRYIIIPLIDEIAKTLNNKQGYVTKEYTSTGSISTNKNIVQPDPIVKGSNPVAQMSNKSTSQYNFKEANQYDASMGQSSTMVSGSSIGESQMVSGSSIGESQMVSGSSIGESQMVSETNVGESQMVSETNVGESQMVSETSVGESQMVSGNSIGESQMVSGNSIGESQMVSEINVDENSIEDGVSIDRNNGENDVSTDNDDNVGNNPDYNNTYSNTDNYSSVQQIDEPVSVNNNNESTTNQTLEESNFTKEPLLVTGSQETTANESIEDNESILIKIAQKLQEVEKEPDIIKGVNSGIPLTKGKSTQATIVRDDIPQSNEEINAIAERTAEELERIIARLKADQTINSKIKDIEEELTKLHSQNDESEIVNKSHIEEKIEARYIEKQVDETMNEEERDMENVEVASKEIFEKDFDTSPRNALNFIKKCIREFSGKGDKLCKAIKKPLIDSNESIQEEIDYISEIDRKIKEIEERRKQERNQQ